MFVCHKKSGFHQSQRRETESPLRQELIIAPGIICVQTDIWLSMHVRRVFYSWSCHHYDLKQGSFLNPFFSFSRKIRERWERWNTVSSRIRSQFISVSVRAHFSLLCFSLLVCSFAHSTPPRLRGSMDTSSRLNWDIQIQYQTLLSNIIKQHPKKINQFQPVPTSSNRFQRGPTRTGQF